MKIKEMILMMVLLVALPSNARDNNYEKTSGMDSLNSQDDSESKIFRFIYVAPDKKMDRDNLIKKLETYANLINYEESPAFFYLPDDKTPIIVRFHLDGEEGNLNDELIPNLRKTMSWKVTSDFDCKNILSLLSKTDFIDTDGNIKYKRVDIDFLVGGDFWDKKNNENVIATLFFELNVAKYLGEKMQFNVYFRGPEYRYNECVDKDNPFGNINYDRINSRVKPRREED